MHLHVLEKDKNTIKVELRGESATLSQLVATTVWELKGEAAAVKDHPFMAEEKIIINATNPQKTLEKAGVRIEEQCDEFQDKFKKAMKK